MVAGRMASQISIFLQGKHKINYDPATDCGDTVAIENVADMKFTGKKMDTKLYHRTSRYPGHVKTTKLSEMMNISPSKLLQKMVFNMLPDNKLRKRLMTRLTFVKTK